ncbi:uncharacterized protein SCHCODRAFT_02643554 [Schizophyllum commune H4-8]|nr:uncharacterized protein SCHCODRAFT_02643554 [Schizophyllum commune H4-8]KAI5886223.1 hypothetical protein SCHCODRAFT_02643554 [Schizophyllum commune H4-8]
MSTLQLTSRLSREGSFAASGSAPHAPSRSHTISRPSHRASDTPAADLKRHKSLWCTEPKGIVIRAQNWIFRVPEGRLRRMALMFPMREEGRWSTFEGSPMIELPHSCTDVELFLFALFNEESLDDLSCLPLSDFYAYRMSAGILKLSGIYHAPPWRKYALQLLAPMFPTTLDDLDELYTPSRALDLSAAQVTSRFVVDAARAARARWLLPSATLYLLSESLRDNGTRSQLRADEFTMRDRYTTLWTRWLDCMCAPPPRECDCATGRCDARLADFAETMRTDKNYAFSMDVMLRQSCRVEKRMCHRCKSGFRDRYDSLRQWFWDLMPAVCGVDAPWAELARDMRRDTLEGTLA